MSGEFGALTVGFQTLHLREGVRCRARVSFVRRERAIGVRLCPAKPSLTWSTKKDQSNVSRDEPSGKSSNWATEPRELSGTDTQNTTPDPSSHIKSKNRISTRHVLPLNAMHETIRTNNKKLKTTNIAALFSGYRPLQRSSMFRLDGMLAGRNIFLIRSASLKLHDQLALTDGRRRELLAHQPFQFSGLDHNVG